MKLTTPVLNALYPSMLRTFYGINAGLKKDGILAPAGDSLQNTRKLYNLIGQPLDNIPTIHVGGTNGKVFSLSGAVANFLGCNFYVQGTTSFKISESLRLSGYRTGLFVSPHLASFRERVQVNATLIPEENFVQHLTTLLELCANHNIPATEFELAFLLASMHFKQSNCEAVVLEVV
jgi:dihydrofolate synthase/folylpolyglutamate synthase